MRNDMMMLVCIAWFLALFPGFEDVSQSDRIWIMVVMMMMMMLNDLV